MQEKYALMQQEFQEIDLRLLQKNKFQNKC